jgi:outer membrane protein
MHRKFIALAFGLVVVVPAMEAQAQQDPGPWLVRLRAVHLDMKKDSAAGSGMLTPAVLPSDAIRIDDKTIPELDVSYFFTKNLAAELVLTYPQKHDVKITKGPLEEKIGSFKHLPPTLLLQYHFLPEGAVRPYVGAGINYTRFSDVRLRSDIAGQKLTLENSSTGPALQAGFDLPVTKNMVFNVDVKKIWIDSAVKINGGKVSKVDPNPLAIGVGLGWRF